MAELLHKEVLYSQYIITDLWLAPPLALPCLSKETGYKVTIWTESSFHFTVKYPFKKQPVLPILAIAC